MKIKLVAIGSVHEDPANLRVHSGHNLDAIKASLARFGQQKPIVVDSKGVIRAGNGTHAAALALGWDKVAVTVSDLAGTDMVAYAIADNRTAELASWDEVSLAETLRALQSEDYPLEAAGFTDGELDALIEGLAGSMAGGDGTDGEPGTGGGPGELGEGPGGDFTSPYPWFGGKSAIMPGVWRRFGAVENFVDPFFGSMAALLCRPGPFTGTETVNDADGFLPNFWRAVAADPEAVAAHADWPVSECDLHARHSWLVGEREDITAKLEGDPEWFDPRAAGWWVWGACCWIGSGWCSGQGPWQVAEAEDGSRQLVHLGDAGRGVNRKRVHLGDAGMGVNRKRVHLFAPRGILRDLEGRESQAGAGDGSGGLLAWFEALSERLKRVRVCCGDWARVCGPTPTVKMGLTAVFLDPPYADTAGRTGDLYANDSLTVAHAVRRWAVERGDDPRLRVALCGYDGEHAMPDSWECVAWKARGGYGSQGDDDGDGIGRANSGRERVWFSPHCLKTGPGS